MVAYSIPLGAWLADSGSFSALDVARAARLSPDRARGLSARHLGVVVTTLGAALRLSPVPRA